MNEIKPGTDTATHSGRFEEEKAQGGSDDESSSKKKKKKGLSKLNPF